MAAGSIEITWKQVANYLEEENPSIDRIFELNQIALDAVSIQIKDSKLRSDLFIGLALAEQ